MKRESGVIPEQFPLLLTSLQKQTGNKSLHNAGRCPGRESEDLPVEKLIAFGEKAKEIRGRLLLSLILTI